MTLPGTFETTVRETLAAHRPTPGATAELRARIDGIPGRIRPVHPVLALLQRMAVPLVAAGIAVAAVLVAELGLTRAPVTGLPPFAGGVPVGFDPTIDGVGLITGVARPMAILGAGVSIVAALVVVGTFLGPRAATAKGRLIIVAAVALALAASATRTDGFLARGSTSAQLLGLNLQTVPTPVAGDDIFYVTAAPGGAAVTMFSIRNTSLLPVRIEGVVVPAGYSELGGVRWSSVWLPPASIRDEIVGLDRIAPFEPRTIEPGGELQVYLAARAGRCAFGPTFDPDTLEQNPEIAGLTSLEKTVEVAFSVFGLASTTVVDTGAILLAPERNECS